MSEQTNNPDFTKMDIGEIIGRAAKRQEEELAKKTPEDYRREWLANPNNMVNWFPKLLESGVSVPETVLVEASYEAISHLVDGKRNTEDINQLVQNVESAIQRVGYPVFIRGSFSSNKHYWKESCFVRDGEVSIVSHIIEIVQYEGFGDLFSTHFIVRKLIDTDHYFYAFDGKMPVTKERRYFISDEEVICHHPYWPQESIVDPIDVEGNPVTDWQEKLEKLNYESELEIKHLSELSRQVGKHFDGFWSVDWLSDINGNWNCIDMALGSMSYHWKDCEHNLVK